MPPIIFSDSYRENVKLWATRRIKLCKKFRTSETSLANEMGFTQTHLAKWRAGNLKQELTLDARDAIAKVENGVIRERLEQFAEDGGEGSEHIERILSSWVVRDPDIVNNWLASPQSPEETWLDFPGSLTPIPERNRRRFESLTARTYDDLIAMVMRDLPPVLFPRLIELLARSLQTEDAGAANGYRLCLFLRIKLAQLGFDPPDSREASMALANASYLNRTRVEALLNSELVEVSEDDLNKLALGLNALIESSTLKFPGEPDWSSQGIRSAISDTELLLYQVGKISLPKISTSR